MYSTARRGFVAVKLRTCRLPARKALPACKLCAQAAEGDLARHQLLDDQFTASASSLLQLPLSCPPNFMQVAKQATHGRRTCALLFLVSVAALVCSRSSIRAAFGSL